MAVVIAHIDSETTDKTYEIRIGADLRCYCTCPGWKFSKTTVKICKHLQRFMITGLDIVGERVRQVNDLKPEFQIRAMLLD